MHHILGVMLERKQIEDSVFSATEQMATLFMGGELYMLFRKFFPRVADWERLVEADIGF